MNVHDSDKAKNQNTRPIALIMLLYSDLPRCCLMQLCRITVILLQLDYATLQNWQTVSVREQKMATKYGQHYHGFLNFKDVELLFKKINRNVF